MPAEPILPIDAALHLAKRYEQHIRNQLEHSISADAAAALADELDLFDKIFVSLNRSYTVGATPSDEPSPTAAEVYNRLNLRTPFAHQVEAFDAIARRNCSVLISAGTGSGKTEAFLAPIIHHCLETYTSSGGIRALVIYPMNALAGDQLGRLRDMLKGTDLRYGLYVGSTPKSIPDLAEAERRDRASNPSRLYTRKEIEDHRPEILVTNHVMLERMLTGSARRMLQDSSQTLRFVVLDELHTFRGAKADHLTFLLRRLREILENPPIMIGASATLGDDRKRIIEFGTYVLGVPEIEVICPSHEPLALNERDEKRQEDSSEKIAAYGPEDLASSPLVHRIADRLQAGPVSIANLGCK
jgi:ATP-dependent helicase YprA (DUF1998 family)